MSRLPLPGPSESSAVSVAVSRANFDALLSATVRARQALNDRLPNIAEAILEAAIDEGYKAIGRDLGDES